MIHDTFGVVPDGHPRLAPLIRPGDPLPRHVEGYGLFTNALLIAVGYLAPDGRRSR